MPPSTLIVGAGVIGCACAYELARAGVDVQVIDRRGVAQGATQASAGMLAPYIEAHDHSGFLDFTVRGLGMWDEFVARVERDGRLPIPYERTGTLQVASDPERLSALVALQATLRARGVESHLLDERSVRTEEPLVGPGAVGGLVIAPHGYVSAVPLTRGLAAAAMRSGARFVEDTRVTAIDARRDGRLTVTTDHGAMVADRVVLAAGCWSGQMTIGDGAVLVPTTPVRGQLVQLGFSGPSLRRVTWGDRCYLVPWTDGSLLVGATVEDAGFDERTTVAGVRALLDAVCELVPHASTAQLMDARAGLRPGSVDGLPILGRSRTLPGLVYATGHFRNGILLAPLTACLVADIILDRDAEALPSIVDAARLATT